MQSCWRDSSESMPGCKRRGPIRRYAAWCSAVRQTGLSQVSGDSSWRQSRGITSHAPPWAVPLSAVCARSRVVMTAVSILTSGIPPAAPDLPTGVAISRAGLQISPDGFIAY